MKTLRRRLNASNALLILAIVVVSVYQIQSGLVLVIERPERHLGTWNMESSGMVALSLPLVVPSSWLTTNTSIDNTKNNDVADQETASNPSSNDDSDALLVRYGDSIYTRNNWDGSPVIIPKFKLVFFTTAKVGCTVWKQLFRRMMGLKRWKEENTANLLPWNPEVNGLRYLYHYNRTEASHVMTDPTWTRAIIVRDPKTRFLSAWLDKVVSNPYYTNRSCCPTKGKCVRANTTMKEFLPLAKTCQNAHWMPQARRMEYKYWPTINFVGHMETIATDAERLLRKIGAWEVYGASGWGPDGNASIFHQHHVGTQGRLHATNAMAKLQKYYTPELERLVDEFYAEDYRIPKLELNRTVIFAEQQ